MQLKTMEKYFILLTMLGLASCPGQTSHPSAVAPPAPAAEDALKAVAYPTNVAGASAIFTTTLQPETLSYAGMSIQELPGPAFDVKGYFANTNLYTTNAKANPKAIDLNQPGASPWIKVLGSNLVRFPVSSPPIPPPYTNGSYSRVCVYQYRFDGPIISNWLVVTQTISVDQRGTVTISKLGEHGVRRETNGFTTQW